MTNDSNSIKYGTLALALCMGGLVLAVVIGVFSRWLGTNADLPAFLLFLGFQVAAFVLGVLCWKDILGKAVAITSAIMAVGSLMLMG